jgi:hypothetical protein
MHKIKRMFGFLKKKGYLCPRLHSTTNGEKNKKDKENTTSQRRTDRVDKRFLRVDTAQRACVLPITLLPATTIYNTRYQRLYIP